MGLNSGRLVAFGLVVACGARSELSPPNANKPDASVPHDGGPPPPECVRYDTITVLATLDETPQALAVVDGPIYVATSAVHRITSSKITLPTSYADGPLRATATHLYYLTKDHSHVVSYDLAQQAMKTLANPEGDDQIKHFKIAGDAVVWVSVGAGPTAKTHVSTEAAPAFFATPQTIVTMLGESNGVWTWTKWYGNPPSLWHVPTNGEAAQSFYMSDDATLVAVDPDAIYVVKANDLYRQSRHGAPMTLIAKGGGSWWNANYIRAADSLLWVGPDGSAIFSVLATGGTIKTIISGDKTIGEIAADACNFYWFTIEDQKVYALAHTAR